ncbi:MAG: hypothetical protein ACOC8E_08475 [Planctomycetota bacterium]
MTPVFRAVPSARVRPGTRPHEAVAVLPNRGLASVHVHYRYRGGRVTFSEIAVINHYPDRATVFPGKTRVYVDDGPPLQIARYRELTRERELGARLLEGAPEAATGMWLFPSRRLLSKSTVRGPVVVLSYSVKGHDGFVKIRYEPIWDIPE